MAREPRNIGASVRARLLDRARTAKTDFQILLTRYALERLLYRLSVSDLRERFVLKGAMLFAIWRDDPFRPTRDLDLLGSGDTDPATIAASIRSICSIAVPDDGVVFDVAGIEASPIRDDTEYGVRVRTNATIAGAPTHPDRYRVRRRDHARGRRDCIPGSSRWAGPGPARLPTRNRRRREGAGDRLAGRRQHSHEGFL